MKKVRFIIALILIFVILFPYTNTVFAVYENELVNTIKKYNLPLDYSDISVKKALEMLKNICE